MLEGYITPLLMSYIDKYIKNIKPSDLQVSFWGGDAVLRNLELRLDVLEKELGGFPLEIQSGKIRELSIHLPWNAIASTSVEVTIQDLELVMKMKSMRSKPNSSVASDPEETDSIKTPQIQSNTSEQPGYLQGYMFRIINNGKMHIKRMVIKIIEEESDLMLTFNIGSFEGYTTDEHWENKYVYTDYLKDNFSLYKECVISDMTVNLHPIEGLGEEPHQTKTHEPFVPNCSFTGRMKVDFRGNMFVKKSVEILFDTIAFQVNENQFCLFIHILDWLLAAYYSTKRLKGDKETPVSPDSPLPSTPPLTTDTPPDTVQSEPEQPPLEKGWGSWMMSFVASQDESGAQEAIPSKQSESKLIVPSSSYAMSANTVTVTLNVTHKVQVPIFYSMRSFTSPVIHFHFTGCTNKLETVPQSKLFLYTLGIMSVEASITGLCPCVKKFPPSWRKNSTASIAEATEKIPVFSSGEHSPDPDVLSQQLLRGSLFDPAWTSSATIDLPPATKEDVARVGEHFKSLWISYLYFDTDASRSIEECFERVAVGRSKMAVSPDVVHRLQHFWGAYSQSMEATPPSSKGKVVRGDPIAVTNFDIEFAGGHMIFTPNAHFIPTSFPDQSKYGSPKHARKQPSTVAAICATCEKLDAAILQPMYSRNASPANPQKVHTTIQHDCLAAGVVMIKSLSDVMKEVSLDADVVLKHPKQFLHFGKCMDMPRATSTYDSTSIGDISVTTSSWEVGFNEATCVGTLKQLEHFLSISGAWFWGEPLSSRADITFPSKQPLPLNMQLHGVMKGLSFTQSYTEDYSSTSVTLSGVDVAVLKEGARIPVVHGPLNTSNWNTLEIFTKEAQVVVENAQEENKLLDFFMATPYDKLKDEFFPVVQLEMAGCVISLEPSFVEYLKLLPLDVFFADTPSLPHPEPQAPSIGSPMDSSPPRTLTSVDSLEAEAQTQESGIWSMLKTYEFKVKTSPVLLVFPSQEMTCPPSGSAAFPLLPALTKSEGSTLSNSALLASLPSLRLESARGGMASALVVEREGRPDSLPWDCGLASLAVFTVMENQAYHYLLEPLAVKATLAPQQEGSGITIHSDTVTVSLSKEQVELVYNCLADVLELVNALSHFFVADAECDDKDSPSGSVVSSHAPSHLSSPAPSTHTHSITLPAGSDISTVSSFLLYQGLSSLWIQVIAPKLVFKLYAWDYSHALSNEPNNRTLVKLSIEVDGMSLQADIQEKCTDVVFKLASMEASLYQKSSSVANSTLALPPQNQWIPRISSSNGKIFSSVSSVLPKSLSQEAASASPIVLLPSQQHTSPTAQSNFVLMTIRMPQGLAHQQPLKLSCNVQPFEVCAWLPVLRYVSDIGSPFMTANKTKQSIKDTKDSSSLPFSFWPSLDVRLENFRVVFPDDSYASTLLLDTSSLHLASTLDFPSPDVRLVIDDNAFKRLARLSLEKQLPPLPLYQLDILGMSMMALIKEDCVKSFLCTSVADLRAVYTPPLCLTTPTQQGIPATGHSLELNLLTDVTLFLGYNQVKCATAVFESNTPFLSVPESATATHQPPSDLSSLSLAGLPSLKVFLAGKTLGVSILQRASVSHDLLETQSDSSRQTMAPLVHFLVYNPFITVQIHGGCIESELSCFNMAALYSQQPVPTALTFLTSAESVSSLLECKLLATAQGCSMNGLAPSLLTASCSFGEDERSLSIDVGRPVKLSLSRGLIEGTVDFLLGLEELVLPYLNIGNVSTDSQQPPLEEKNNGSDNGLASSSFISNILNSEVSISTSQMLFELKLSNFLPAPLISREQSVVSEDRSQDELIHLCQSPSLKECLLAGWDSLVVTVPLSEQKGLLSIKGVQLLSVFEGAPYYVVPPAHFQFTLSQHLYTHNLSQVLFDVNCGVLEVAVSQASIRTVLEAASLLSEVTEPLVSKLSSVGSSLSSPDNQRHKKVKNSKENVVSYCDDLRSGDFKYLIHDDSVDPPLPAVGEIVFHVNAPSPTMTWCYSEPRALTHLTVLPVPFGATSNTPIKVKCSLLFWCAEEHCFSTLLSFYVSETAPSEHTLSPDAALSTVWRVAIVQCLPSQDEDDVFLSKTEILDNTGSSLPLTTLLSPVSLAASLRVDSILSPSSVASLSFSFRCKEFVGTLFHHIPAQEEAVLFDGYPITLATSGPQELLRMGVRNGLLMAKCERSSDISVKVTGELFMDYVDFCDLVWRTAAYPTKMSGAFKYSQSTEAGLDTPPCTKSLSVCLRSSPALFRLSQGLVHSFSLAAHIWLNNALAGSRCGQTDSASLLLNHYIICNDTINDIHVRQYSTDEDVVIGSGECTGYSWCSHVTSPRQLQLCLAGQEVWSKPFTVDDVRVERVELEVEGETVALYIKVTDLGGLQKQVTLFGRWKLFSTLPFPVDIKLCPNIHVSHDDSSQERMTPLLSSVFALAQNSSLSSIVGTEAEVDGVMFRAAGNEGWSKVYPLTCNQGSKRPQLLAEFPCDDGSIGFCWYNMKPLEYWKDKPWGSKISLSPLFAVSNLSPFELTLMIDSDDNQSTTSLAHSDTLPVGKGQAITLSPKFGPDVSYNVGIRLNEEAGIGSPPLVLSTLMLHDLPFLDATGSSDVPPTRVSLPLSASGDSYILQASFERSHLNTITVVLNSQARLTNNTPYPLQVMGIVTGNDQEATSKNYKVAPQEQSVLSDKEFALSLHWNGVPLCSKPIETQKASKKTDQKLLSLTQVCSPMETASNEKVVAQLLVTTQYSNATIESTVSAACVLHNNTKNLLCINPIMITGKVSQELLTNAHKDTSHECSLSVKQGESEPIVFWNSVKSKQGDQTLTQVICMSATQDKVSVLSIFLSPKFVRRSFSLPSCDLSHSPHILTRHEADGVTYLVLSEDPFPRFYFQNLCATDLEVVECGTTGVNAFPQLLPSGCEVVYEPPSIAKLYPLVFDPESTSEQEKELKDKASKLKLKIRQVLSGDEPDTWSKPFPLSSAEEKVLPIPNFDMVFISTDKRGCTATMSIIPTKSPPLSSSNLPTDQDIPVSVDLAFNLEQIVVCVDDEVTDPSSVKELLRMYGDDLEMHFSMCHRKSTQVKLSMKTCQVDNMHEKTLPEYSVVMISRSEHVKRPSLIQTEFPPVAELVITFDPYSMRLIDNLRISCQPVTIQLEDSLLQHLKDVIFTYLPPGVMFLSKNDSVDSSSVPAVVLQEAERDVSPLFIANLIIEPVSFFLSASITLKVFLSCNNTPFNFSAYHLKNIYSNLSEVLQLVGSRYVSSAFMNAAWVLGSLEIIGSPGTLIQNVGQGIRDLVMLPYQGLSHSPAMFVLGLGQGATSFIQNCSSGALSSVTNLATSLSRNMEQLSMDPDHASYQEQIRRQASVPKFSSGVRSGVSSFGLSLMSAVAGIVDQPMQSYQQMDEDSSTLGATRSILTGIGKGVLGVVTKPMGGAMELVSKTGQGIMHGTGLAKSLGHRKTSEAVLKVGPILRNQLSATLLKCVRRLRVVDESCILCCVPATYGLADSLPREPFVIIMTSTQLHFVNTKSGIVRESVPIRDVDVSDSQSTLPGCTLLQFKHSTGPNSAGVESLKSFHVVENYLKEQEVVGDSQQEDPQNIDKDSDCFVYATTEHYSSHFMTLYHSVTTRLKNPDSGFSTDSIV